MLEFGRSQRGFRQVLSGERFNSVRFNPNNENTTWRCAIRPCKAQVVTSNDHIVSSNLDHYHEKPTLAEKRRLELR